MHNHDTFSASEHKSHFVVFCWSCNRRFTHVFQGCVLRMDISSRPWVGLLSRFPAFHYVTILTNLRNLSLRIAYRVYIWQVPPQLIKGGTSRKIDTRFRGFKWKFRNITFIPDGEFNERVFCNPHLSVALDDLANLASNLDKIGIVSNKGRIKAIIISELINFSLEYQWFIVFYVSQT